MTTKVDHIKKQAANAACFFNGQSPQLRQLLPTPLQLLRQIRHLRPVFFDQVCRGFVGEKPKSRGHAKSRGQVLQSSKFINP
jgi:hypothetical protein